MNIENNKLTNRMQINMANSSLPKEFVEMEIEYKEFKEKINKSDFANSPQRYIMQRGYEKFLRDKAITHSLSEKEKEYSDLFNETEKKLYDLGVTIND